MFVIEFSNGTLLFFFETAFVLVLLILIMSNVYTKDKTRASKLTICPLDLEQNYEMLSCESGRQRDDYPEMRR